MPTGLQQTNWFPIRGFDDSSPPHLVSFDMASNLLNVQREEAGISKRDGTEVVNDTIIPSSATVLHQDTLSLSNGTSYEVFQASGDIYTQNDVTASVLGGFNTTDPVYTAQLLDTMIFAQGVTAMRTWDGTSSGIITASPKGKYLATHLERLWTAGIDGQLSLISSSAVGDINTWSGAGTADINVSQNDGQRITGLAVFKNDLIIFKDKSVWKLIGTGPANYQLFNVDKNIGCVEHRSIRNTGDALVFASDDGIYIFDGNKAEKISDYQDTLWSTVNKTRFEYVDSTLFTDKKEYLFTFPTGSNTTNSVTLVYYYDDLWRDQAGRVHVPAYKWTGFNAASLHTSKTGSTNEDILYIGDYTGFIKKRTSSKADYGNSITSYIDSPFESAKTVSQTKNLRRIYLPVETNVGRIDFYANYGDNESDWILAESMLGVGGSTGDEIGISFEIGVSPIGISGNNSYIQRVNTNGIQGRRFKIRMRQDSDIRTWAFNGPIEMHYKLRGHQHG